MLGKNERQWKKSERKKPVTKGLFTWARLTGLARFPRSRLTSKSFVKFSMCSYERAGWLGSRDLGKRAGNFAIWTLHPGYWNERRDEFSWSGWHRLSLPAVFYTSSASHLTAVIQLYELPKPERKKFCVSPYLLCFPNLAPKLVPRIFDLFSSRKPGWNFSYEPKARFIPVTESARSTGLIWRGPKKFLEVSRCSRVKQQQRNVQKKCAARAKLLFC